MATHKSKQHQQWSAQGHAPLKPNEHYGRVRFSFFQFHAIRDAEGAVVAQNDDVELLTIPAGARLIAGEVKSGSFGASVTLDIGLKGYDGTGFLDVNGLVPDDPDAIATNVDISSAVDFSLFEENAFWLYETEKELILTALFEGANPADNIELAGYVEYVVD